MDGNTVVVRNSGKKYRSSLRWDVRTLLPLLTHVSGFPFLEKTPRWYKQHLQRI